MVVASFSDKNPSATAASFTASINWGDGTAATVGTVVPNSSGGVNVLGSHTYTTAPGSSGAFTITTTLTAASGASLQSTTQANVSVIPLTLTGQLNPASDSGLSNQDGITNVTQPNFNGTSEPGAVVTLVASPLGGGSAIPDRPDRDQFQRLLERQLQHISPTARTPSRLSPATASGRRQARRSSPPRIPSKSTPTAPQIGPIVFNRATGQISILLQDNLSGFNLGSVTGSGYSFTNAAVKHAANLAVGVTAQPLANGATSETVLLTIKGGKKIKSGTYTLTVPAGIQNVAGNSLGRNFVFVVKPAKKTVVPAQAKPAAVTVHDAALHAVHTSAAHHRRLK